MIEMENELQIFTSKEFGEIRVMTRDDEPWFVGKDITEKLEYRNGSRDINRHVDEEDRQKMLISDGNQAKPTIVINESGLYSLILSSKLPTAKKFKRWVTSEVIPSIRKHGAYMTKETIEKAITSPDFLIQLATKLKEEQEARKLAEEELTHKQEVLEGLTDNISLADKRRRINQIVRKGSKNPTHLGARWNMLYREFELKHHMNLDARLKSAAYASISPKNKLDLIDKGMGMIDELYEVCCKLYESDYEKVLKEIKMVCA